MELLNQTTLKAAAAVSPPSGGVRKNNAVEEFAASIERVITNLKDLPEGHQARVYCQGKNGVDFRVGNIQIAPSGMVVISGKDDAGNSVYSVSYFERTQFVCEVSKVDSNEPVERKPIGFSR
jgi:hypothetical protein